MRPFGRASAHNKLFLRCLLLLLLDFLETMNQTGEGVCGEGFRGKTGLPQKSVTPPHTKKEAHRYGVKRGLHILWAHWTQPPGTQSSCPALGTGVQGPGCGSSFPLPSCLNSGGASVSPGRQV